MPDGMAGDPPRLPPRTKPHVVVHARRSAGEAAMCGVPSGSQWTDRGWAVTSSTCRRELDRRLKVKP